MTADYTYGTYAVYDPSTNNEVDNGTGGKFVLVLNGPAQPIYDLNGTPIAEITSNALGQSSQFRADSPSGLIQFGSTAVTVFANEVGQFAIAAMGLTSRVAALEAAAVAGLNTEAVQDAVAAFITAGTGMSKVYDDTAGTLTLSAAPALDTEAVQDAVAAFLLMGSGMSKVYDDTAGTLTLAATAAISLANVPVGYTHTISYAAATAAVNRAAITSRTDIYIRIYGGLDSDPDPSWMIDGDYRDLIPAG